MFQRGFHSSRKYFEQYKCVAVDEVEAFVGRCMNSVGAPEQHCTALAQVLTAGDVRGHFSHGLNRLGEYYTGRSYYLVPFGSKGCSHIISLCRLDYQFGNALISDRAAAPE